MIFDRDYVFQTGGFKQITTLAKEAGIDVPHERLQSPELSITEPGYVYIYLSNESIQPPNTSPIPIEVYFDDFQVTHTKSPVVQSNDHFAHGMDNSALSYQRENSTKNNFLYNAGSEVQTTIDANVYDTYFRGLDVSTGRWQQVDPLSDRNLAHSPYSAMFNDPIYWNDPSGAEPPDKKSSVREQSDQRIIDRMFNDQRRMYGVIGDDDLNGSGWGSAFEKYGPGDGGALNSFLGGIEYQKAAFAANQGNAEAGSNKYGEMGYWVQTNYRSGNAVVVNAKFVKVSSSQQTQGGGPDPLERFVLGFGWGPRTNEISGSSLAGFAGLMSNAVDAAVRNDARYISNFSKLRQVATASKYVRNFGTGLGVVGILSTGVESALDGNLSIGDGTKFALGVASVAFPVFGIVYGLTDLAFQFGTGTGLTDRIANGLDSALPNANIKLGY
ncbi:MAG: hypothetical protein KA713_04490 [Chryseotalea sp. WA131a]|nr:MAG: hypothetical protein KA713_04490 [Chryseotalea sp. WA131a]